MKVASTLHLPARLLARSPARLLARSPVRLLACSPAPLLPFRTHPHHPPPVLRLHTLGALDLRSANGREVSAVLRQPKRLALLAYLAVSAPRRFHRRDALLALFWPELDQEHARASLRRSIYFLRSELGAEVIAGRGDEELAVPDEELWCDATALDAALAAGDPAGALALYRGPLL